MSCAKTAEPIDLSFGLWIRVGRKKHKINRIRQMASMCPHGRAHLRHLSNTIEPSVCCGDAALCQITLTTCFNIRIWHGISTWKVATIVCWMTKSLRSRFQVIPVTDLKWRKIKCLGLMRIFHCDPCCQLQPKSILWCNLSFQKRV